MHMSRQKNRISKLPQNPGVYIFKSKNGETIYIGKATNLRSRVQSYFQHLKRIDRSRPERPKADGPLYFRPIEQMIHEVADIKTIQTDSVLEALILESGLIKKYLPKYNAMGKDDKSFSYFVITKEKFPRIMILRKTDLDALKRTDRPQPKRPKADGPLKIAKIFGPYASKKQMEIALKIIRKIFPFHSNNQKTEKGCLDFQLGRCPGPYAGAITRADYLKNIRSIKMILEGKKKSLVKRMEKEMHKCAEAHKFEKAAELRNKIFALKHIQDVALIFSESAQGSALGIPKAEPWVRVEAYDISNISGQYAVGSMVVFLGNEPDKSQYRKFKIRTIQGADDVGMMREVLLRRFKNDWPQPDLIFLDGGKGHLNMGEKLLKELGMKILIVAVAKGLGRKSQILNPKFQINPKSQIPREIINILRDKNLIKRIMDEAHRFAIGYHKKLRRNSLLF